MFLQPEHGLCFPCSCKAHNFAFLSFTSVWHDNAQDFVGSLWFSRGTGVFLPKQKGKFSPAACARRTQKIRTRMALSWWRKIGADVRGQHGCQFSDPKCFGVCDTETSETQHIPPHLVRSVPCPCLQGAFWHISTIQKTVQVDAENCEVSKRCFGHHVASPQDNTLEEWTDPTPNLNMQHVQ